LLEVRPACSIAGRLNREKECLWVDVKSDLEVYFRLNDTARRIVRTAARMGSTPLACAVFELYFPELTPDRLRSLREELTAMKDCEGTAGRSVE
jgi:hypothetical protein